MAAIVYLLKKSDPYVRTAMTSKAFNCVRKHELMREHTLEFSLTNDNPMLKEIAEDSIFECDGQKFDIATADINSGGDNLARFGGEHVSYALSDYMIPDGYSYVGSLARIVVDILQLGEDVHGGKAKDRFTIGNIIDIGTVTFSLIGQENVTVRAAILALQAFNVEIDFNNFRIDIKRHIGQDGELEGYKEVDFSKNLIKRTVHWDASTGKRSFDAQLLDDGTFALGDDVEITDSFLKETQKSRIISFSKCIDDPSKSTFVLDEYVRDSIDAAVDTGIDISATVKQGESYNNVAITHAEGFTSTRADGKVRIVANGTDGFAVQKFVSGAWVTVNRTTEDGLMVDKIRSTENDTFYVRAYGGTQQGGVYDGCILEFRGDIGNGDQEMGKAVCLAGQWSFFGEGFRFWKESDSKTWAVPIELTFDGDITYQKPGGGTGTIHVVDGCITSIS